MDKVNLDEKLSRFDERWKPKIVATLNDYDVLVVKVEGEFVWHRHDETDELFLVLTGRLTIDLRSGSVELRPGELLVVPKGVEHRPRAEQLAEVVVIEPRETLNTGDAGGDLTATKEPI